MKLEETIQIESASSPASAPPKPARIESVDLLRGLVMVLMVADHAREYANLPAVGDPVDLTTATPGLFFTRWIAHFCAPAFVLLAGVSASFVGVKRKEPRELSSYLAKRGLVLILLEFTVIDFSWKFNLTVWPMRYMQVIWALGMSMLFLALLVRLNLSKRAVLLIGALIVLAHNLFDGVSFAPNTAAHYLWSILHQKNVLPLGDYYTVRTTYPLLPLIGLMALGYGLGELYRRDFNPAERKRLLLGIGAAACIGFVILRAFNLYGDPYPFTPQSDWLYTLMSLLNTVKYPTSLLFLLMTLGPALLLLAALDGKPLKRWAPVVLIGRVPMFYYIAHLYLLHLGFLLVALLAGYPWSAFDFRAKITGMPAGFGFPLWGVYLATAVCVGLLYPCCRWYDRWRRGSDSLIARYI
jgi:uncharacterized membrane protein